jgi:hypothetical protein
MLLIKPAKHFVLEQIRSLAQDHVSALKIITESTEIVVNVQLELHTTKALKLVYVTEPTKSLMATIAFVHKDIT